MREVAIALFAVWLVFLIGWIGGMFYAGEVILLPPPDMGPVEWLLFFAAMYVLPLAATLLFFRSRRANSKDRRPNA